MRAKYSSILITGASSGIGHALARAFAGPRVHLALNGRSEQRLAAIAQECRAAGAVVRIGRTDVRLRERLANWIEAVDAEHPLDLVIAGAGISTGTGMGRRREIPEAVRGIVGINLLGVLNTVEPAMARMSRRGRGRIAIIGSMAAIRGLPYSPSYCATKAAVHCYAEAIRANLRQEGVGVTLIIPGFVSTAMNRDLRGPHLLETSAENAAAIIRRGLERAHPVIAFPRLLYFATHLTRLLPARLVDAAMNRVHVDVRETEERGLEEPLTTNPGTPRSQ